MGMLLQNYGVSSLGEEIQSTESRMPWATVVVSVRNCCGAWGHSRVSALVAVVMMVVVADVAVAVVAAVVVVVSTSSPEE